MIYSLIPFILLISSAISLAAFLRKSFSELLAPVLFSVILTLYSFYIFDKLHLGAIVVTAGLVCATVVFFASVLFRQTSREYLKQTAGSRSFLLFLAAMGIFLLFSTGKIVNLWDSLRLWGAYPKVLHTTGSLQLGSSSVLYPSMQSYSPGMPLLCYYVTAFSPTFPESSLYFCYNLFGFSLLLPLIEEAGRSGKRVQFGVFIGALYLPWLISSVNSDYAQYYSCLFIDIPLGLCAGYTFFRALRNENRDFFSCFVFSLACGCLALLKEYGSFIALCCIFAYAAKNIVRRDSFAPFKGIAAVLLPFLTLCFAWGSWSWLRNEMNVSNHLRLDLLIPTAGEFVRIVYHFLVEPAAILLSPFGSIGISLPVALLTLFTLKYLLCRYAQPNQLRFEIVDIGCQILCYAGFFIGYCFIFIEHIRFGEFPSYSRYLNTILACALYIFSADCIYRYPQTFRHMMLKLREFSGKTVVHEKLARCILNLGKFVLAASLAMFVIMTMVNRENARGALYISAKKYADTASSVIPASENGEYTDVYLVIPGDDEENYRLHHRIYFELIDDGLRVKNYFDVRDITDPELQLDPETFMDKLIQDEYDYVMLTWTTDDLLAQFASVFPEAESTLIYRVDPVEKSLIPVSDPVSGSSFPY